MNVRVLTCWLVAGFVALCSFGCMTPEVKSDFTSAALAPAKTVDCAWAKESLDLSKVRKLVVALPELGESGSAFVDGLNPKALASVYQELLVEELLPACDTVYVVRYADQPLISVRDLKPYAHKIKTLTPSDPRLVKPARNGDVAVVETRIVTLDPGSKWQRYVIGCGAGMTTVQVDGRLHMLGTPESLLEWRDRTGSWVPRGSVDLFYRDLSRLAEGTGELVAAARSGDAL